MNILCNICSEFLTVDDDFIVTVCGHCFHHKCIQNWNNTSRTCPTCRTSISQSSIIKVYVEDDHSRLNDLHNELLTSNEKLTKELEEIKEKNRKQEHELTDISGKYRESKDKVKKLEREKQLDSMALVTLKMIKEESGKEIIKLNAQINTLKLDLLAEKQLRRIHQKTLHQLDPQNETYDTKSIAIDDQPGETINHSNTPFWQLYSDSNPVSNNETVKKDHSYIIPSKIQKANEMNKFSKINPPKISAKQKRSSSREDQQGETSSSTQSLVPLLIPESQGTNSGDIGQCKGTFSFNFGNSSNFTSLFRFGSSNEQQNNSQNSQPLSLNSNFRSYRETRNTEFDSPRSSER